MYLELGASGSSSGPNSRPTGARCALRSCRDVPDFSKLLSLQLTVSDYVYMWYVSTSTIVQWVIMFTVSS